MIIEAANIKLWHMAFMGFVSPFIGYNAMVGFALGIATLIILKGVYSGGRWQQ